VSSLRFSPDGRTLASGCGDGLVRLWDTGGSSVRQRPGPLIHRGAVRSLAFSPDGATVAALIVNDDITLWDVTTGRERTTFHTGYQNVHGAFTADGQRFIVATSTGIILQSDLATGRKQATAPVHWGIYVAASSADGRFLAGACDDDVLRVWNLAQVF
jgi:WD40 repeat protein